MTAAAEPTGTRPVGVVTTSPAGMVHFPCPSCGGGMTFSSVTTMKCEYCGSPHKIAGADHPAEAPWRNFSEAVGAARLTATPTASQPGFESELLCPSCGGVAGFSGTYNATRCPYCAHPVQP